MSEGSLSYNLLLFGNTGSGKSETGNTLLGRKVFETTNSLISCTQNVSLESCQFESYTLNVVDTPGIHDTNNNHSTTLKTIYEGSSNLQDGVDAFLLVLKMGNRHTEELNTMFEAFVDSFGEPNSLEYCIIVFSFGDSFDNPTNDNVVEWCRDKKNVSENSVLAKVLKACNYRVVVFSNKDASKREGSIKKLLSFVKRKATRYTNGYFKDCVKARKEYVKEIGFLEQRPKFQERLSRIQAEFDNIVNEKSCKRSRIYIAGKARELLRDIEKKSAGRTEMDDFKSKLNAIIKQLIDLDEKDPNFIKEIEKLGKQVSFLKHARNISSVFSVASISGGAALTTVTAIAALPVAIPVAAGVAGATILFAIGVGLGAFAVYAITKCIPQKKNLQQIKEKSHAPCPQTGEVFDEKKTK